jgi:uncharacterized membrane protein YfcA
MMPDIYLPIAKHSADILLFLALGGAVGFVSGLFGVGGGFLMTPLLIMCGIPPIVAAASDTNQIIAAATSGSYAHYRMGNIDLKMGILVLSGSLLGGSLGVEIIKELRVMGEADFLIKITYVVMLSIIGNFMLIESIRSLRRKSGTPTHEARTHKMPRSRFKRMTAYLPWQMNFDKSGVTLSPILPLGIGLVVGTLSSILGVGGGFIMVPMMFYVLRMPMHLSVGTNLFQEAFLCINVTIMQAVDNRSVDLVLAMVLLAGSSIGAQIGARTSRKLHADQLRLLLALVVIAVMVKILFGLLLPPHYLLDMKGI